MEIDTSRVFTDEHREALRRLEKGKYLTEQELEEVYKQLPKGAVSFSKEQLERIRRLESDGREKDAQFLAVSTIFGLETTSLVVQEWISLRLDGLDDLPDQMAMLEGIGSTEVPHIVAAVEAFLPNVLNFTTSEVVRVCRDIIIERYELLEKEFNLLKMRKERKGALGYFPLAKPAESTVIEPTESESLLAESCPLFAAAKPETRRAVWGILERFTRKQWAHFATSTKMLANSTNTERAKRVEQICGLTGLRNLFNKPASNEDKLAVNKALTVLRADSIRAQLNSPTQ